MTKQMWNRLLFSIAVIVLLLQLIGKYISVDLMFLVMSHIVIACSVAIIIINNLNTDKDHCKDDKVDENGN